MRIHDAAFAPSTAVVAWAALATTGCTAMWIRTDPPITATDRIPAAKCAVRLFSPSSEFLADCWKLTEMSLFGDTPDTWPKYCGTIQVREAVRAKACEIGSNAAVITRVAQPKSNCVEARAALYRCAPERLPERPSWTTTPTVAETEEK